MLTNDILITNEFQKFIMTFFVSLDKNAKVLYRDTYILVYTDEQVSLTHEDLILLTERGVKSLTISPSNYEETCFTVYQRS